MTVSAPAEPLVHLRSLLRTELRRAGVLPDDARYDEARRAVTRAGVEEFAMLQSAMGQSAWDRAFATLDRADPQADCVRVLGFGRLLTEFMLPAEPLEPSARANVLALGALANFIVTLFDHLADHGTPAEHALSPAALRKACAGHRAYLALLSLTGRPATQLLARLVTMYFRRLDTLPYATRHGAVRGLVSHVILAMYAAEVQTLDKRRPTDKALRRKSALPIVVMGLPAWLAAERAQWPAVWPHLRYLYRLGEFIGMIDDVVDAEGDNAAGRPNRVVTTLGTRQAWINTDAATLARDIASEGAWVLEQRSRRIGHGTANGPAADALGVAVLSWLEGAPSLEGSLV